MLFVGTSIIHPSTEGVFLLCNILDLLIYSYKNDWRVSSNRESGEGFSDIVIETGNAETGIVIEVKYTDEKKDLERDCRKALEQIRDKDYTQILRQEGYKKMVQYGIAFHLKQCCVMEEEM